MIVPKELEKFCTFNIGDYAKNAIEALDKSEEAIIAAKFIMNRDISDWIKCDLINKLSHLNIFIEFDQDVLIDLISQMYPSVSKYCLKSLKQPSQELLLEIKKGTPKVYYAFVEVPQDEFIKFIEKKTVISDSINWLKASEADIRKHGIVRKQIDRKSALEFPLPEVLQYKKLQQL